MMETVSKLVARSDDDNDGLSPTVVDLIIALLILVLVALSLVGGLLFLRRRRRNQSEPLLPVHNGQRRLTITATQGKKQSVFVIDEKRNLLENSSSPPQSPVPEIRLTFPEEEDETGKRKSGRVVVVRISEAGSVGLEPYHEELPPYQSPDSGRFQSLDLERMGGLKEKEDSHGRL